MAVNFKDLGGGQGGDDHPILMQAIASGVRSIYFPEGNYRFDQDVELKRTVRLYGDGVGGWYDPAVLYFPNSGGFVVNRSNTIDGGIESPATTGADWSMIEGLAIKGAAGADRHGINLRARAIIRNCLVSGFGGNGIHIFAMAGSGGATEGNANCWRIEGGRVEKCGGNGVFIDGSDTNAGQALGVDVSGNAGWGIFDSSFLGNTFVGCHAASNVLGAYKTDNANAHSVFVGCYAEENNQSAVMQRSLIVGGLFGVNNGTAQIVGEGTATPFVVATTAAQSSSGRAITSRYGWDGRPVTFAANGDHPYGWSMQWNEATGCWRLCHAGLDARAPIYLTTELTAVKNIMKDASGVALPAGKVIMSEIMVPLGHNKYAPLNLLNVYNKTL